MSKYWEKRALELEESLNNKGKVAYSEIEYIFDRAEIEMQNKIDSWYAKLAANNDVTIQGAKKILKANELKEFQWDVEEYIKYGKKNAINKQWMTELKNASAKVHISRLEAIKLHTQQSLEKAFTKEDTIVSNMAKEVYDDGYGKAMFATQIGFKVAFRVDRTSDERLQKIISEIWAVDGKNFSSRIWDKKTNMVRSLHQELIRMLVTGASPDKAINNMTKYVNASVKGAKRRAGTLVMTEQAYFGQRAQKEAYDDLDVEKVEILATLDSRTSDICQKMDGKLVKESEVEPGVTTPPFHPNCRSTTIPYFEEEFTVGETRAAKNSDGKTYKVPASMKYAEWKEKYYK